MNMSNGVMLAVTLAYIGAFISSLIVLRNTVVKNAAPLRNRAKRQSKRPEARGGEPMLVEVAIPLKCIGAVRCDFHGVYHVQVLGEEVDTDEETFQRVVEARDAHLRRARELGI